MVYEHNILHKMADYLASDISWELNTESECVNFYSDSTLDTSELSDTKAALLYMKSIFPEEKFGGRLPPIIMKHQIYSIIKNKTTVDKEVVRLLIRK